MYTCFLQVEDFTEQSENVARAVGRQEVKRIYECVQYSLGYLLTFLGGQMQQSTLRDILFGVHAVSTLPDISTRNPVLDEYTASPVLSNPRSTKKQRLMEGSGREQNYDASRLGNNLCQSAGKIPSAPTQIPIGNVGSHGHLRHQPTILPQTPPLWLGASHSQDPNFPNQYPGQFNSLSLQDLIVSDLLLGFFCQ